MTTVAIESSKAKIEEEQALIVRSDNPLAVFESLSNITTIHGYKVKDPEAHTIVDRFYDTTDSSIKALKSSLRIRELDGVPYVTIKGKNKNDATSTASKRSELEFKWPYETPSPYEFIALFGLVEKQKRVTERIQRDIVKSFYNAKDGSYQKVIIAELALDTVTYHFVSDTPNAILYEVEIELKTDKPEIKLSALVDPLLKAYPELGLWPHSKYSTGKALEVALQVQLDDQGVVKNEAFNILSALLTPSS